ncbi:hypothetical protein L345_13718, partial [Ophiophagus hannah]
MATARIGKLGATRFHRLALGTEILAPTAQRALRTPVWQFKSHRLKVDSALRPSEVGKLRTQIVGGKRLVCTVKRYISLHDIALCLSLYISKRRSGAVFNPDRLKVDSAFQPSEVASLSPYPSSSHPSFFLKGASQLCPSSIHCPPSPPLSLSGGGPPCYSPFDPFSSFKVRISPFIHNEMSFYKAGGAIWFPLECYSDGNNTAGDGVEEQSRAGQLRAEGRKEGRKEGKKGDRQKEGEDTEEEERKMRRRKEKGDKKGRREGRLTEGRKEGEKEGKKKGRREGRRVTDGGKKGRGERKNETGKGDERKKGKEYRKRGKGRWAELTNQRWGRGGEDAHTGEQEELKDKAIVGGMEGAEKPPLTLTCRATATQPFQLGRMGTGVERRQGTVCSWNPPHLPPPLWISQGVMGAGDNRDNRCWSSTLFPPPQKKTKGCWLEGRVGTMGSVALEFQTLGRSHRGWWAPQGEEMGRGRIIGAGVPSPPTTHPKRMPARRWDYVSRGQEMGKGEDNRRWSPSTHWLEARRGDGKGCWLEAASVGDKGECSPGLVLSEDRRWEGGRIIGVGVPPPKRTLARLEGEVGDHGECSPGLELSKERKGGRIIISSGVPTPKEMGLRRLGIMGRVVQGRSSSPGARPLTLLQVLLVVPRLILADLELLHQTVGEHRAAATAAH